VLSAEKLLSLIDDLGGIVWEADPDTFQFSFVSAQAERILGYPVSAWLEPGFWTRHTHAEDIDRCTRFCLEATRAGRDHAFEYRMVAADGRVVWLRDIVSVRLSPDGSKRLVGIALDITGQKEEEGDKARMSALYEAMLENSSDNINLIRSDGVLVYQSAAAERQLGYPPSEMLGRNNFDLVHPDDAPMTAEQFKKVLSADRAMGPFRFRYRHKDGEWRVLESVAKRFSGEDGTAFVVSNTRDVTEVVEAQEALEATREQLAHAMKMEAIGRLAGGVAHDFNNLLTVISGYAELLAASLEPADPRSDDLDEIKRAAHRASLLTRQLLAFSRKQVLRPEVLDLNGVVRDAGVLMRRAIGEDIQLVIHTPAQPLLVFADSSQLEQVLMNLAMNARDAMLRGGTLTMTTSAIEGAARLTVSDTGSGVPPEVLGRMFEPFFTTKEMGKGTGLGLSTVYGIVKQSGGDIQVTSELGEGTTFVISLPLTSAAAEAPSEETQDVPGGSDTILLVEDEPQVRDLVHQVLTRLGYTVFVAADAGAAVDLCRLHRQGITLLLTDIVMPHVSGPEVYQRVKVMVPGIAVLYMSGYTGDKVFARGVSEEGVAFLQKPFTPVELARKVREVLDNAGRARRTG
jgi:PAS domain S-box-containing protein